LPDEADAISRSAIRRGQLHRDGMTTGILFSRNTSLHLSAILGPEDFRDPASAISCAVPYCVFCSLEHASTRGSCHMNRRCGHDPVPPAGRQGLQTILFVVF